MPANIVDHQEYNKQGMTFQKKGFLSEAEACYLAALQIKPDYAEAHKNLGNVFLSRKMIDAAIACYERSIKFAPDYEAAHINLGSAHFTAGRMELAVSCFKKGVELMPSSSGALQNLGMALSQQGDIESAIDCFSRTLTLERDHWVVNSAAYLTVLLFLTDDIPGALQVVESFKGSRQQTGANMSSYFEYLGLLMSIRKNLRVTPCQSNSVIHVVGDSHALALHNLQVIHAGEVKTCRTTWLVGCKQWHLGNTQTNSHKYKFEAELAQFPRQSTLMLTIGEIDCRWNEGVIKFCHKSPAKSLEEVAQSTVGSYINYVARLGAEYGHTIIVSGVPATNIRLHALSPEVAGQLVRLIRAFNATLKSHALAAGLNFLDVYRLTDRGDGVANGDWHLDDVHLTPLAYAEAFNAHYIAP